MIAVIFEVIPTEEGKPEYLEIAAGLRKQLSGFNGFISIERFQSLTDPKKILSLSFWENEEAVTQWRNLEDHRVAQGEGKTRLFREYRIRVGKIYRDYTLRDSGETPPIRLRVNKQNRSTRTLLFSKDTEHNKATVLKW